MDNFDIQILDYGLGNTNSIASCLRQIGCHAGVTSDLYLLRSAKLIFIPGVGSFDQGMKNLADRNLIKELQSLHSKGNTYFIGICLGMQLFANSSTEGGKNAGLGWIPGEVRSLKSLVKQKTLPHIGWNSIQVEDSEKAFLGGLNGEQFYFDHEYYMDIDDEYVEAYCEYESNIPSVVQFGKVYGFQFHPEKSQVAGKKLLINTLNTIGIERRAVWIESV